MFDHKPELYNTNGSKVNLASELTHQEVLLIAQFYSEWRAQGITNRQIAKHYLVSVKHLKKQLKASGVTWIA